MKTKTLIKLGLFGVGAYLIYQNRRQIVTNLENKTKQTTNHFSETKQNLALAKDSLDRIQHNLAMIMAQKDKLQTISKELNYSFQTFNADTQARLSEIKQITGKYQDK